MNVEKIPNSLQMTATENFKNLLAFFVSDNGIEHRLQNTYKCHRTIIKTPNHNPSQT